MVCEAKYKYQKPEFTDLLSGIEDIVDEAIGRDCDIVLGRVAAELSRQSKQLYALLDKPGPAALDDDDEGDWYGYEPVWVNWCLGMTFAAIGFGVCWVCGVGR